MARFVLYRDSGLFLQTRRTRVGRLAESMTGGPGIWQQMPDVDGIIICMKKTLHIDEQLLRDAKAASGARTDTETIRLGLEALVRRSAYERLRALRGSEPGARETPRRRERRVTRRHSVA